MIGLANLRDCMINNYAESPLVHIDLMYNRIGERGATILAAALGPENTKTQDFFVDLTLPLTVFEQIHRRGAGAGKKGGKKKKGKK